MPKQPSCDMAGRPDSEVTVTRKRALEMGSNGVDDISFRVTRSSVGVRACMLVCLRACMRAAHTHNETPTTAAPPMMTVIITIKLLQARKSVGHSPSIVWEDREWVSCKREEFNPKKRSQSLCDSVQVAERVKGQI